MSSLTISDMNDMLVGSKVYPFTGSFPKFCSMAFDEVSKARRAHKMRFVIRLGGVFDLRGGPEEDGGRFIRFGGGSLIRRGFGACNLGFRLGARWPSIKVKKNFMDDLTCPVMR